MKKRFPLLSLFLLWVSIGLAQTTAPKTLQFTFGQVSTTGALGAGLTFDNTTVKRPFIHTIDASVTGTAPTACTFRVEGSSDGTAWYGLDATAPSTTSCTAGLMEHIAYKPVIYIRINVVAYTPGDGTTKVIFHYTGG